MKTLIAFAVMMALACPSYAGDAVPAKPANYHGAYMLCASAPGTQPRCGSGVSYAVYADKESCEKVEKPQFMELLKQYRAAGLTIVDAQGACMTEDALRQAGIKIPGDREA